MNNLLWLWRSCSVGGLLGLITLIILWNGWLSTTQQFPRSIEILILILPLLPLVRGILKGSNRSHVFSILVSLLYATLGVWYLFSPHEAIYGWLMILASSLLYIGGFMSAKLTGTGKREPKQEG